MPRSKKICLDSIVHFTIALVFVGAIGGCMPVGNDDDSTQAKLQRNEEKLKLVYSGVTGTYNGSITVPGRAPMSAAFVFYTVKIDDKVDSNNVPKSYTELRAQLRFDQVGEYDDHVFKVDFKERTGEVFLTQVSDSSPMPNSPNKEAICPVGPKDSSLQARGFIIGGRFQGDLISAGKVGSFEMERKSAQADIPVRDQAERLMRAFERISGSYDGAVGTADEPLAARVVLRVEKQAVGNGLECPELVGYFRYKKAVGELNDSAFKVNYRESTGAILFNYQGTAAGTQGNAAAVVCAVGPDDKGLKIEGRLQGTRLVGSMTGVMGDFGPVRLQKVSDKTDIEKDQGTRLENAYESLVGTYAGRFKGVGGEFPVKIIINLVTASISPSVVCPVLTAQYARPDMTIDPSFGMLLLKTEYYPRNERLVFKTDMPPPSSGHAGHRDLSIDAQLKPSGFSGRMTWWNRTGTLEVKRCRSTMVTPQGACRD